MTKDVNDKTELLIRFAELMPEEWLSPYEREGSYPIRLDIPGSDTLYQKTICYVRLENDLLEAPAIIAILDWLKVKGYIAGLFSREQYGLILYLKNGEEEYFHGLTRIECCVKAFNCVAGGNVERV